MAMPIGELSGRVRPLRRPAARGRTPLDALDHTHRRMLALLEDAAVLQRHLEAGHWDDPEARRIAQSLCRFFGQEARQHHADEERHVFPALVARGEPGLTHHVLRLQQDHGWLEEDWFQIEPHLQAIAQGFGGADAELLRQMLPVYDALLHEHIALEETLIYPAARAVIAGH